MHLYKRNLFSFYVKTVLSCGAHNFYMSIKTVFTVMLTAWIYPVLLFNNCKYSKIPILRQPLELSKSGLQDHLWIVPKAVSNQKNTGCRK